MYWRLDFSHCNSINMPNNFHQFKTTEVKLSKRKYLPLFVPATKQYKIFLFVQVKEIDKEHFYAFNEINQYNLCILISMS